MMTSLHDRYKQICDRLTRAEADCARMQGETTLIAVSKTFDTDAIRPLLDLGHRVFGENRVQEAKSKWPMLIDAYAGVELHLIGSLQSNKALEAVQLFDVIHVLDRTSLAKALAEAIQKVGRAPRLFVQVNTGEEPQKGGVLPHDLAVFLKDCKDMWGLEVQGLMCIPPADQLPSPHFAFLAQRAKEHGLPLLSMGMSGDFEQAVQLGATHVRLGSAIFGVR
jgi:PLP dependent protein